MLRRKVHIKYSRFNRLNIGTCASRSSCVSFPTRLVSPIRICVLTENARTGQKFGRTEMRTCRKYDSCPLLVKGWDLGTSNFKCTEYANATIIWETDSFDAENTRKEMQKAAKTRKRDTRTFAWYDSYDWMRPNFDFRGWSEINVFGFILCRFWDFFETVLLPIAGLLQWLSLRDELENVFRVEFPAWINLLSRKTSSRSNKILISCSYQHLARMYSHQCSLWLRWYTGTLYCLPARRYENNICSSLFLPAGETQ